MATRLLERDYYPEINLRRLKAGGYVAGMDMKGERFIHGTGDTLKSALAALWEQVHQLQEQQK